MTQEEVGFIYYRQDKDHAAPECPQDASEELGNAEGSPYTNEPQEEAKEGNPRPTQGVGDPSDTSIVDQVNRAIRDVCEAIDRGPEPMEHWEEYQAEQKYSEGE